MPPEQKKNIAAESYKKARKCMDNCITELKQLSQGTAREWIDYFSLSLELNMQPDHPDANEELYLEITRELYLMRKHSFEKDGKYLSLSQIIREIMKDPDNKFTQQCKKHNLTDEKKICEIYNQYLPQVFRGLPTSFGL